MGAVYVQTFPGSQGKWVISTEGGDQPMWRGDGKGLFYIAADNKLVSVQLKVAPSFEASRPDMLFQTQARRANPWTDKKSAHVATPDGQRFLINVPMEDPSDSITVVVNWTAALPR